MKVMNKLLTLLLCMMMVVTAFAVTASAAATEPNVTIALPKTEVNAGDVIDVWLGVKEMTAASVAFGLEFDTTLLQVTGVSAAASATLEYSGVDDFGDPIAATLAATSVSTKTEANADGRVGAVWASGTEVTYTAKAQIVRIRFTALKTGTVEFDMFEDSSGVDGYKGEWTYPEVSEPEHTCSASTLTKKSGQAPTCVAFGWKDYYQCTDATCGKLYANDDATGEITDLDAWKLIGAGYIAPTANHADKENDGDHKCDTCTHIFTNACSGGTATCVAKAVCAECGQPYGNMGDHNYGDLVQATEAVHTQTELKGAVAAHYFCDVCDKYFTDAKVETTLEALTGEAPQHAAQADDGDCTTDILCSCGKVMVEGNATHTGGTATCVAKAVCAECGQPYGEFGNHVYGELKPAQEMIHSESTLQAPVAAHYHCVCGTYFTEAKVETTLAALTGKMPVHEHAYYYYNAEKHQSRCICGYNLMFDMEPHVDENADEKCDVCTYPMHTCANNKLTYVPAATANCSKNGNIEYWECSCGKYYSDANATTEITDKTTVVTTAPNDHKYGDRATGWYQIGSDWYYGEYRVCDNNAAHVDHTPVTGLKRVPYPTVAINGVTYAPNAEDLAYYNAHKSSSKYSDADTAEFYFGEDGKFQATYTGKVGDSYVVNGIAPWHVGFVKIGEDYYYFAGDKTNGGNVMATGKVYATRANNTGKANGIYNFDTEGKLIGNYYGLYEYNGDIYYRRTSTGELATGWYYITVTNGIDGFKEGDKLFFGEDGKMADPKNGIVEEGGKLYYYVNNSIKGAGLIEIDGDYYYARTSTGEVVTGEYHITVTNGIEGFSAGQKCVFGTDGKLVK